ncbi:MAG: phosphodiester glycosidase family protein [Victivallaceae bacterium]|nr:phosphodiester glycosidase family protein [Victivallaceae bacterium]
MKRVLLILLLCLAGAGLFAYTPTTTTTYNLADGLVYHKYTYSSLYGGYQEIFVLEVDLTKTSLETGIGICQNNMLTNTTNQGKALGALAAVNCGFFAMTGPAPSTAVGMIVAQGKLFKGLVGYYSNYTEGFLWMHGQRAGVVIPSLGFSVGMANNLRWGYPVLVQKGAIYSELAKVTSDTSGIILSRRSRTAVGVTSTRQKMYIVVVDESGTRYAVTCKELADYMISLGCYEAINLDGGGSSTMWTSAYGLMNRPENGTYQRPVYDVLYIRSKQASYPETDTSNPSMPSPGTMTKYTPKGAR